MLMGVAAPMVLAGDRGIERSEDTIRVCAVKANMPIVVRLEQMRLIGRSRGVVNHRIVCHAVEDKARDTFG
jgi:hypothetical protein